MYINIIENKIKLNSVQKVYIDITMRSYLSCSLVQCVCVYASKNFIWHI